MIANSARRTTIPLLLVGGILLWEHDHADPPGSAVSTNRGEVRPEEPLADVEAHRIREMRRLVLDVQAAQRTGNLRLAAFLSDWLLEDYLDVLEREPEALRRISRFIGPPRH